MTLNIVTSRVCHFSSRVFNLWYRVFDCRESCVLKRHVLNCLFILFCIHFVLKNSLVLLVWFQKTQKSSLVAANEYHSLVTVCIRFSKTECESCFGFPHIPSVVESYMCERDGCQVAELKSTHGSSMSDGDILDSCLHSQSWMKHVCCHYLQVSWHYKRLLQFFWVTLIFDLAFRWAKVQSMYRFKSKSKVISLSESLSPVKVLETNYGLRSTYILRPKLSRTNWLKSAEFAWKRWLQP